MYKFWLYSIFLFTFYLPATAVSDNIYFNVLNTRNGLSNNHIQCIMKDSRGFMWFGTAMGLNRYDGYEFKIIKKKSSDPDELIDNRITNLVEDNKGFIWITTPVGYSIYDPVTDIFVREHEFFHKTVGLPFSIQRIFKDNQENIWFITEKEGIYRYSPTKDSISKYINNKNDTNTISCKEVTSIVSTSYGYIWLIDFDGILELLDPETQKIIYRNKYLNITYRGRRMDNKLFVDSEDNLWIFSNSDAEGLFLLDYKNNKNIIHFQEGAGKYRLNNNIIADVTQDKFGFIWVGTDHGGINIIDKKDFSVKTIENNPDDERSLAQNSVTRLYRDDNDIIWVGTYKKGICYYHPNLYKFPVFRHQPNNSESLFYDDVDCFQEDENGNIWIGTNGEGFGLFSPLSGKFKQFKHNPLNNNSLSNDVVVSMLYDSQQNLWLGTFYGGLDVYNGKTFKHFRHNPNNTNSISNDRVWSIFEDSHNNIWIGTLGGGLDVYDPVSNIFRHYKAGEFNSVKSNFIICLAEDSQNNLWVGTDNGIDIYEYNTKVFSHFGDNKTDSLKLSSPIIQKILEDKRGLIWIATQDGLNVLDKNSRQIRVFKTKDGLIDNSCVSMLEDDLGNIWLGSSLGLTCIKIIQTTSKEGFNYTFINYSESDGLQSKEFNQGAAYKTKKGKLIFGGPNGFNMFDPQQLEKNSTIPKVYISGFQILNKEVASGQKINGRILLQKSISETQSIKLKYFEDIITIEFTALNYIHSEENKYKYILEGFNREWISTDGNDRKATYTNLDPGKYIFKVVASNNDGLWNETGTSLHIEVMPPFWKSRFAFLAYLLILAGSLLLARKIILMRERMKYSYEQEKIESQRRHELDLMKIRFFTNVSHEFRTPLTLIISPLEKIIKESTDSIQKPHLELIYRNARRLLNLVNQLLDFRRMEVQKIGLKPTYGDIVTFSDEIYTSFSDLAERKNIKYNFYSTIKEFFTYFDHDKLEKIIFNLLSNAFKFTGEHGLITLNLDIQPAKPEVSIPESIIIKVTDTGIGMTKESTEKIFERFFQNDLPGSLVNHGSGIGLSLTKEFVMLHNGTIEVDSEPGKGSCFTVKIPVVLHSSEPVDSKEIRIDTPSQDKILAENHDESVDIKSKPLLLLVEDNDDFRFYLKDNLKVKYSIIEANNGTIGIKEAQLNLPDLIVSDIMMPETDGLELCRVLKTDVKTSHIPIILLTARVAEKQKLAGFETGADDYIIKPFSFEILESRIQNLISQRQRIKKSFQKHFKIEPGEIGITSLDEKLINKTLILVESNMGNPQFSVEKLSKELGMSRVHLYKKLLALTGKTPIEFIRTMRLKRAAQLLEKSQLNVSEIAYEVGFNDPRYFSKYFKNEFGVLPSQYQPKNQEEVKG